MEFSEFIVTIIRHTYMALTTLKPGYCYDSDLANVKTCIILRKFT